VYKTINSHTGRFEKTNLNKTSAIQNLVIKVLNSIPNRLM